MMKNLKNLFLVLVTMLVLPFCVFAESGPLLQLNSGGPTATVRALLLNTDESLLVAGGDDKIVRVWDANTLQLVRTIRGQSSSDIVGAINIMALSPDDKWLAVSVFYPHQDQGKEKRGALRIYDFESGKLLRILKGHSKALQSLNFSQDGSMLLGGESLEDNPLALIWDTQSWQLKQKFSGHEDGISGASFTPDQHQIVTSSWDKSVRVWDIQTGKNIKTIKNAHKGRIYDAAIPQNADVPIVVSSGWDKRVNIWNYKTGKKIKSIRFDRPIRKVVVDASGKWLLAASSGEHVNAWIAAATIAKGKVHSRYRAHDRTVRAMIIAKDGNTVFSSGGFNNELDKWQIDSNQRIARASGSGLPVEAVGISADGDTIFWGQQPINWSGREYNFNTLAPLAKTIELKTIYEQLGLPRPILPSDPKPLRSIRKVGKFSIERKRPKGSSYSSLLEIKRKRKVVGSVLRTKTSGHIHTAYTLTPDGGKVISGGENGYLSVHGLSGEKVGDFVGHHGNITSLAVSADGEILVSGSRDQTFKVWSVRSQQLLVSFFVTQENEWIAWNSDGYYSASPNGDEYVGWQLNQGFNREADYVKAAQLRKKLYRPDIINQVIKQRAYDPAAMPAGSAFGQTDINAFAKGSSRPPKFEIIPSNERDSKFELAFDKGTRLPKEIDMIVNGYNYHYDLDELPVTELSEEKVKVSLAVNLQPGANTIGFVAENAGGETRSSVNVIVNDGPTKAGIEKNLYVVAVGVNDYDNLNNAQDLDYAANDAIELIRALKKNTKAIFSKMEYQIIADGIRAPTTSEIKNALKLFEKATVNDTVILFAAGHGVMQESEYLFLAKDAAQTQDSKWSLDTVVKWNEIQAALSASEGRRILLVDTCHAGNAFSPRLVKDASDSNIVVLTSTDGTTLAQEDAELRHGVFTYSLIEGILGSADSYEDGRITITEILAYVTNAVSARTKGEQQPVFFKPGWLQNFDFAVL